MILQNDVPAQLGTPLLQKVGFADCMHFMTDTLNLMFDIRAAPGRRALQLKNEHGRKGALVLGAANPPLRRSFPGGLTSPGGVLLGVHGRPVLQGDRDHRPEY